MRFSLPIVLAALLMLPACNQNAPRTSSAAPEDRTNVTDQMKRDRDDYVKNTEARLAEFDQNFDGLSERAKAMTGTTKANFNDAIDRLRDQRKAVASKLSDLKGLNVESWTAMREEVNSGLANLERSYNEVSEMFEKAPATSTAPYS